LFQAMKMKITKPATMISNTASTLKRIFFIIVGLVRF